MRRSDLHESNYARLLYVKFHYYNNKRMKIILTAKSVLFPTEHRRDYVSCGDDEAFFHRLGQESQYRSHYVRISFSPAHGS